jgi:hypothetical protein
VQRTVTQKILRCAAPSFYHSNFILQIFGCAAPNSIKLFFLMYCVKLGFRGIGKLFSIWDLNLFLISYFLFFYFLFFWVFWDIKYLQSPFSSPFNIEVLYPINAQLKGDALRCCFSSNQLTSFVLGSSPFERQLFLEYSNCFQRGIQGDWETTFNLGFKSLLDFLFLIFYFLFF